MLTNPEINCKDYQKPFHKTLNARSRIVIFSEPLNIMEEGQAIVRKLSTNDVVISDLVLPNQLLPIAPFQVGICIEEGHLKGLYMTCFLKGITNNHKMTWRLRISKIGESHRQRLDYFLPE